MNVRYTKEPVTFTLGRAFGQSSVEEEVRFFFPSREIAMRWKVPRGEQRGQMRSGEAATAYGFGTSMTLWYFIEFDQETVLRGERFGSSGTWLTAHPMEDVTLDALEAHFDLSEPHAGGAYEDMPHRIALRFFEVHANTLNVPTDLLWNGLYLLARKRTRQTPLVE